MGFNIAFKGLMGVCKFLNRSVCLQCLNCFLFNDVSRINFIGYLATDIHDLL